MAKKQRTTTRRRRSSNGGGGSKDDMNFNPLHGTADPFAGDAGKVADKTVSGIIDKDQHRSYKGSTLGKMPRL